MSSPLALEDGVSRASSATAGVSSRAPALDIASIGAVTTPKSLGSDSKTFESHPHHNTESIHCTSSIFDVRVNLAGASAAQVHKTPDIRSPQRLQAQHGHQITFQEQIQRVQSGKGLIKPPQSPFEESVGQNAEANLPPFPFQSAYRTLQSGGFGPTSSVLHSPPLLHIKSTGNGSSVSRFFHYLCMVCSTSNSSLLQLRKPCGYRHRRKRLPASLLAPSYHLRLHHRSHQLARALSENFRWLTSPAVHASSSETVREMQSCPPVQSSECLLFEVLIRA